MSNRKCACGAWVSAKLDTCPQCGAAQERTQPKRSEPPAQAMRPLTLAPRSAHCDNHVCREIRAAYHVSHEYRLRHLGEVERQAGED